MTRLVGGQGDRWGQVSWSGAAGGAPLASTWNTEPAGALSDLLTETVVDPLDGVPMLPGSTVRFALYIHDPSLDPDVAWGSAQWGTAEWSSSIGAWRDITDRLRGVTWQQGTTNPGSLPDVGTAALTLDNQDGLLSPWATEGEFVYANTSMFRAGRLFRFGWVEDADGALIAPFFTGRIESLEEGSESNVDSWLTVNLAELTSELAVYSGEVVIPEGKTSSAALLSILEHIEWPYQDVIEVPDEEALLMAATVGGYQDAKYASTLMEQVAAGLHWALLSGGNGKVRAVQRHRAESVSIFTFSNDPQGDELPMVSAKPYASTDRLLNQAAASRLNGTLQRVTNEASKRAFGLITDRYEFPRDDLLLQDDDAVNDLLTNVVTMYGFDDVAIESIVLDMDMAPDALLLAMNFLAAYGPNRLGINLRWVHPSGQELTGLYIISGAKWALTMQGDQVKWTAALTVEVAS